METIMNKIVLAAALLSVVFSASVADARTYKERTGHHAAKTKMIDDNALLQDGRTAYSAQYSFVEHDPAFSPQQDEIYNAR
jgi:hypothetical protein